MYAFLAGKQYPDLAKAEILALCGKSPLKKYDALFLGYKRLSLAKVKRLAFTKAVYDVLFVTKRKNIFQALHKVNLQKEYVGSYAVRRVVLEGTRFHFSEKALADMIWAKLQNPKVDLTKPQTIFTFFFHKDTIICAKRVWVNVDNVETRKPHKRPEHTPVSLSPKLAKAMVNLSKAKAIHDPFCGTGGIVIEAGLMGLEYTGGDLDRIMVNRANINLKHFTLKHTMKQANALELNEQVDAIVTDLPFGKNAKLLQSVHSLFTDFLKVAYPLTKKMVIGIPSGISWQSVLKKTKWKKEHVFTIYLNKSVSKLFLVLRH